MTDAPPENAIPRAFVIGHPIAHSRSPVLHGRWLQRHGLKGSYEAIDIAPDDLEAFLSGLGGHGFVGGNVTLPHKEAVSGLVTRLDDAARRIGAVNTVWFEDDVLVGGNTDGYGFLANLDAAIPGWSRSGPSLTALMLGAGGAARAVAVALAERGIGRVVIANRTVERAELLCDACGKLFAATVFEARSWEEIDSGIAEADILVNTTSLGMTGQPPLDLPVSRLPSHTVVNDLVYNPLKTKLLSAAETRGNPSVDGLGMLLHQAVPGFERWFGVRPDVDDDLREAVLAG